MLNVYIRKQQASTPLLQEIVPMFGYALLAVSLALAIAFLAVGIRMNMPPATDAFAQGGTCCAYAGT
jgi:hypothetical protein